MCEALAEQLELSANSPLPRCCLGLAEEDSEEADPLDVSIAEEIRTCARQAAFLERRCAQRFRALAAGVGAERASLAVDKAYETEMEALSRLAFETVYGAKGKKALRASEGAFRRAGVDPHMEFSQSRQPGDNIEAITNSGEWNHAIVLKVVHISSLDGRPDAAVAALVVRFPFWGAAFDECIEVGFGRIAPLGTHLPIRRYLELSKTSDPTAPQNPAASGQQAEAEAEAEAEPEGVAEAQKPRHGDGVSGLGGESRETPLSQKMESAEASAKHFNLV
eukprot:scaffold1313_cov250-Pinguiococcus_pyrenoidosus.AAC.1